MKIARIETADGEITHATPCGPRWLPLEGSLEQGWSRSGDEIDAFRFLPPLDPPVIYGIGLNYRAHAVEMNVPLPDHPVVFMKNPAAVTGHLEPVFIPRHLRSDQVDYEVELAVIIGKRCKNISRENALDVVAGYTVANDVSARDWQKIHGGGQWVKGKSFDSFCPLGPVMVTADEIPDPSQLQLRSELNGNRMQDSSTADLIFGVPELIEFLSGSSTLLPGTVILTGTPPGVGAGRKPPVFLQPGDHLISEIEGIGRLENPVQVEG